MDLIKGDFVNHNYQIISSSQFDFNSLKDRKSVYEVLRVEEFTPMFFEDHLNRLKSSISLAKIQYQISDSVLKDEIKRFISFTKITEANIKIVISQAEKVDIYIYFLDYPYPSLKQYENGVNTITYERERFDPNIKFVNHEYRKDTEALKKDNQVYEAILVNSNQEITEGSRSNVFFIKDEKVITTLVEDVLPGVTRKNVIQLCKQAGIALEERKIALDEIKSMDSCFITGTSPRVLAVRSIDEKVFDVNNSLLRKILSMYADLAKEYIFKVK